MASPFNAKSTNSDSSFTQEPAAVLLTDSLPSDIWSWPANVLFATFSINLSMHTKTQAVGRFPVKLQITQTTVCSVGMYNQVKELSLNPVTQRHV
jgi:hypothetical protein